MASLFAEPAASFDDPVALLSACHDRVRHYASLALKLAQYLPEHGADNQAREAASSILRYFDVAAPLHHQDEEEDLFPLLAERGDEMLKALVGITMFEQHVELAALWQQVRARLLAIAAGESSDFPLALATEFSQRYPAHAQIEDEQIYPFAAQLLSQEELTELGRHMATRRGVTAGNKA